MSTKTYDVLGTGGWTAGEVKEWYAITQQPGWFKLVEYLKRDKIQLGGQALDPACTADEHRALQGRSSLIDDILILSVILKDKVSEVEANEKALDKDRKKE